MSLETEQVDLDHWLSNELPEVFRDYIFGHLGRHRFSDYVASRCGQMEGLGSSIAKRLVEALKVACSAEDVGFINSSTSLFLKIGEEGLLGEFLGLHEGSTKVGAISRNASARKALCIAAIDTAYALADENAAYLKQMLSAIRTHGVIESILVAPELVACEAESVGSEVERLLDIAQKCRVKGKRSPIECEVLSSLVDLFSSAPHFYGFRESEEVQMIIHGEDFYKKCVVYRAMVDAVIDADRDTQVRAASLAMELFGSSSPLDQRVYYLPMELGYRGQIAKREQLSQFFDRIADAIKCDAYSIWKAKGVGEKRCLVRVGLGGSLTGDQAEAGGFCIGDEVGLAELGFIQDDDFWESARKYPGAVMRGGTLQSCEKAKSLGLNTAVPMLLLGSSSLIGVALFFARDTQWALPSEEGVLELIHTIVEAYMANHSLVPFSGKSSKAQNSNRAHAMMASELKFASWA